MALTIITVVVIALLTVVIFGLTWLAYTSVLKAYRLEVTQGKHDAAIKADYESQLKNKKKDWIGIIFSYTVLSLLSALFVMGLAYRISGENFILGDTTHLVIKTGSMSEYYNEELEYQYKLNNYATYHFDVGDICIFQKLPNDAELVKGEVYGYKYKNMIITHRLININGDLYEFRGDNNSIADPYYVQRSAILFYYTGQKIPGIGAFILFAQSYFGLWSITGIIGIAISSEVVIHQVNKTNKARYIVLLGEAQDEK